MIRFKSLQIPESPKKINIARFETPSPSQYNQLHEKSNVKKYLKISVFKRNSRNSPNVP